MPADRRPDRTWRRPAPFVAYPDGRAPEILGSPAHPALGLDVAAWCESSRYQLDGRLPLDRVRRIRGWTADRQAALVAVGFWRLRNGSVELVDYLRFNRTRAVIRRTRKARSDAAADAAAGRSRGARGEFAQDG